VKKVGNVALTRSWGSWWCIDDFSWRTVH